MKRILLCLCLATVVTGLGVAQSKEERAKRSDEIISKSRKIDLLNQILPLLLSKDQITQLLPSMEKVRANVEKEQKFEYEQLLGLEADLDRTITAGETKGELPKHDFVMRITKVFRLLDTSRQIAIGENIATVKESFDKVLNAGQKKAAANLIDATFFDPTIKPEDLTEERKITTYIKVVLLDNQAYPLLLQLLKRST